MPVDEGSALPHSAFVALGEAVDEALGDRRRKWLAEELDVDAATISRILNGAVEPRVDQIVSIERALGLTRGHLFRAMGLIEEPTTFDDWLKAAHPRMGVQVRRALSAGYQAALGVE